MYGYLLKENAISEVVEEDVNLFTSVAFNEYINYKNLLESCTDEAAKPILEAQVNVLYEVGIKDIFGKIKQFIADIFIRIGELISKVGEFIQKIFGKDVATKAKNINTKIIKVEGTLTKEKLKKIIQNMRNESALLEQDQEESGQVNTLYNVINKLVNEKDFYFEFKDVVAPGEGYKAILDVVGMYASKLKQFKDFENADTDKLFGRHGKIADDFKYKDQYCIFNRQFIGGYLKKYNTAPEAISKYIDDQFDKHFISDMKTATARLEKIATVGKKDLDSITDFLKDLKAEEKTIDDSINSLKDIHESEKNNATKSTVARIIGWVRDMCKILSKNISYTENVVSQTGRTCALAGRYIVKIDLILDKVVLKKEEA